MRRVKYGEEGVLIERCHKREQMAETAVGKSKKGRRGTRENRRQTAGRGKSGSG